MSHVRRDERGNAARWVLAYAAAILGDVSYYLILTWAAVEASGALWSGLILALGAIPRVLLMLVGGVLADRHDPRTIAIVTDATRAVLLLAAAGAAAWLGLLPWWLVVLSVLFGVVDACFIPAVGAMPARLVPPDALPRLQAWRLTALRLGNAVGPALGALLLPVGAAGAFASVALLFALSVVLLLTVRSRYGARPATSGVLSPVPLSLLRRHRLLSLVVGTALSELPFSGPVAVGIVLLAQDRGWGGPLAGTLLAAFSIGGLGISLLLGTIPVRSGGKALALGSLGASAVLLALLSMTADAGWAIALGAILGVTTGTTMVVCQGGIQQAAPVEILGRVTALLSVATLGLSPLAYGATGAIAASGGVSAIFLAAAGVIVLAGGVLAVAGFPRPRRRPEECLRRVP